MVQNHTDTKSFQELTTRRIQETQNITGNKAKSVVQNHTDTKCFPELIKRRIQETRNITEINAKAHRKCILSVSKTKLKVRN